MQIDQYRLGVLNVTYIDQRMSPLNNSKSNTKNIKPSNPQQRDSIIWFITEHYLCCYTQTSWPYKGECLHCTCSLTLTGCYLEDTILLFFGIYYKWLQLILTAIIETFSYQPWL